MPLPQLTSGMIFAKEFRVLRHLSAGGMGAVYVVEQLSTRRERALKIMLPDLVRDPRNRERFTQEATVSARIRSDHVVEVVAAGIDEETGTPWLCMELLEGEDLSSVMARRGALPPSEVLEVLRQLGHGLGAAHRGGLVHRDLKPENIFLANSRREGVPFTVKVLDFGIAKVVGENHTAANATSALGSPLWMAPEQAEQKSIRPATDVWALGLIVFHLLTGRYYWRAASMNDFNLAFLLKEIFMDPLEPASARAAATGAAGALPPGFDAWFAGCVNRDAQGRFPSANEAVAALVPILATAAGVPVSPSNPNPVVPPTSAQPSWNTSQPAPNFGGSLAPAASQSWPGQGSGTMAVPSQQGYPMPHTPPVPAWAPPVQSAPYGAPSTAYAPNTAYAPPPYPQGGSNAKVVVILAGGALGVAGAGAAAFFVSGSGPRERADAGASNANTTNTTTPTLPNLAQAFRGPQCRGSGTRVNVTGLPRATAVASGRFHACAVVADGTVRCWGWNNMRQLGDGTTEDGYTPVLATGVGGATAVTAGLGNTCALISNGGVMCWGQGPRGPRGEPTYVDGVSGATQVDAGQLHTCAVTSDGGVTCWGLNNEGQLGDGTSTHRMRPVRVEGLSGAVQVAAGDNHTCALVRGGAVWCWGKQEQGQVGNGHRAREPVTSPSMVAGITNAVQVAAGEAHTCALLADGTVRCWGQNDRGQLGSGRAGNSPTPVAVQGVSGAARLALGSNHGCVMLRDRSMRCWGENYGCQLGGGPFQNAPVIAVENVGPVLALAPGGSHTCALRTDGAVRCWGLNTYGQLGNGVNSTQPDL